MERKVKPVSATPVKLPDGLRDWLKHQAIDNRRTLSNEIVVRLEASRTRVLRTEKTKGEASAEVAQ